LFGLLGEIETDFTRNALAKLLHAPPCDKLTHDCGGSFKVETYCAALTSRLVVPFSRLPRMSRARLIASLRDFALRRRKCRRPATLQPASQINYRRGFRDRRPPARRALP
jgi:hypothetical protein